MPQKAKSSQGSGWLSSSVESAQRYTSNMSKNARVLANQKFGLVREAGASTNSPKRPKN